MGQVWKRTDWNDIIDKINALISQCNDDVAPLDYVPENHKWSVQDITEARNKIIEHCSNANFTTELVKWKQEIVDELNTAMGDCDCHGSAGADCEPCMWDHGPVSGGFLIPKSVGYDFSVEIPPYGNAESILNGVHLCSSGYLGRGMLFCWDHNKDYFLNVGGCNISCLGKIMYPHCQPSDYPQYPITIYMLGYCSTGGICSPDNQMIKVNRCVS